MEPVHNEFIIPVTSIVVTFLNCLPKLLAQLNERRGKLVEANRKLDKLQVELDELKRKVQ